MSGKKTESAGGVVLNSKGLVLVVSQHGTSWSLPKGHIDPGEDALEAAKREIWEESGVRHLDLVRKLGEYGRYKIGIDGQDDTREWKQIHMFLFKSQDEKLSPQDPHNPQALWVDKGKVEALLTHPKDKEFFRSVQDGISA